MKSTTPFRLKATRWTLLATLLLLAAMLSPPLDVRAHGEHGAVRVFIQRTTWFNCGDGFFGGPPDIYFNVDIDRNRRSSRRRPITSNISPFQVNRSFETEVEFSKGNIPIVISQWDADDNADDPCDLKQGEGTSLELTLDLVDCVIAGDAAGICGSPILHRLNPPFQDDFIEFTISVSGRPETPGAGLPRMRDITTRAGQCIANLDRHSWDVSLDVSPGPAPAADSLYTGDSWWTYASMDLSDQDCENFAYLRIRSSGQGAFLLLPRFPTNASFPIDPAHCFVFNPLRSKADQHQHTYLNHAIFRRLNTQSNWQLIGGGVLVGQAFTDRGCVFAIDGNPAQIVPGLRSAPATVIVPGDEGTHTTSLALRSAGEIAIVQQNYGHHFQEPCGSQVCFYPVRVIAHYRGTLIP